MASTSFIGSDGGKNGWRKGEKFPQYLCSASQARLHARYSQQSICSKAPQCGTWYACASCASCYRAIVYISRCSWHITLLQQMICRSPALPSFMVSVIRLIVLLKAIRYWSQALFSDSSWWVACIFQLSFIEVSNVVENGENSCLIKQTLVPTMYQYTDHCVRALMRSWMNIFEAMLAFKILFEPCKCDVSFDCFGLYLIVLWWVLNTQ